jgi:hypothetical protein
MGSTLRIALLVSVLGGVAGALLWRTYADAERRLRDELAAVEARMAAEIAQREAMVERLGRERRRGIVEILSQQPIAPAGAAGGRVATELRFVELDDEGREIGRREYTVPGEVVYIEGWTARFPHDEVAAGDPLRGSTLVLLRRIYSDLMPPAEGLPIDTPGGVPDGYALGERSRLERSLWRNFWRLASDARLAAEEGLRVAQGEAVFKRVRPGERYELIVEAAGGMALVPLPPAVAIVP